MGKTIQKEAISVDTAIKLGLLSEEFEKIKEILGRTPNFVEVSIYSAMWSEHCSYKNSITWLKKLPKDGPHMLAKAGEENAGLVDIGDGLGCAFKIESHNHPSAIEPYQGAATGVGGINRDIFTMGARPVAQLNSLRFGNITNEHARWHLRGVVKGIGDYGNAFGIPVLGGEVFFDECYTTNPLVNAMSVGIIDSKKMISATSHGVGNPVFIVGSATGKDGIHGASFASKDISETSMDDLPAVQVGDPFQEKLLLEASLEIADTDAIIGMQDMGAAGIICSTSEMSAKGKHGMKIWLDRVPVRQQNMQAWEILLSESQERMLVVVKKGKEKIVQDIFDKWDLNCVQIGEVTKGNELEFFMNNELVASVPAESLVLGGGAPVYERTYSEPAYFKENKKFRIDSISIPNDLKAVADFLTTHPNIASKKWVTEQYDTMVGTVNMSTNKPADAGIVNLKGLNKALAVTVDCNARYVYADPEEGCAIAVAEAARNITCAGGEPSAITNCLNFGNPYNPEVYWQFVSAIKGMSKACEKFKTPVTGGNVSFYNQSASVGKEGGNVSNAVFPTPTIGMIGIIPDKKYITSLAFKKPGHLIYLLGESVNDISSSEYLYSWHKVKQSPAPYFNLEKEWKVQTALKELIQQGFIVSAHDCSDGGLYITLIESAMPYHLGFSIDIDSDVREDAFLFGEAQSRVVVSVSPEKVDDFLDLIEEKLNIDYYLLGEVVKGDIIIDGKKWHKIAEVKEMYNNALAQYMNE
ncbi:MAG: phosphoribosylformylglycinamidine synthase subunit PurL [Bacteroidetes bacterium]|nr:phosphoribosylformylglycinamidine synthase subunit PurL [Bacteroidota bacterium]MBV6460031.1 Phosphoribosylformylglycinamidine synthase subunit PurL [Flavobacteriales bacterium]WKZ76649.1 MAG: phosphoribosylformylglycinamidine synthase subunit PurL [Vicingaceae bacterium]MCL4816381.1 phosphoribosylformylglycinamidine synthase subunit PurL [Flavobacteriales bacterium]NOG95456.1 phosphoribosylformylglycinamidine synthase subunit PurL [Bacteroidota bacterium]